MWRQRASLLIGFGLLGALCVAIVYLCLRLIHFMSSLDQRLLIAVLAGAATILASTIAVVIGKIFERKIEIDAHFRQKKFEQSYELLKFIFDLVTQSDQGIKINDDDIKRQLSEWHRTLILFARPKTVQCYVRWFVNLTSGHHTLRTLVLMEEFYKSLRSDLGVSNFGLRVGDLMPLVLGRHAFLFTEMFAKNPNMTLVELARLEEKLSSTVGEKSPLT
jgi:hypothetical protein